MKNKELELQPGKSYQIPKHWGDDIQVGDIFRVTTEYIESHHGTTCIEGDYYIALKELKELKELREYPEFPKWGGNNEFFEHAWTGISTLKMLLDSKLTVGALYGNDLNQLAITIFYTPVDSNSRIVPLSPLVEKAVVFALNDYNTGKALPAGWTETAEPGDFLSSPVGTSPPLAPEGTGDDDMYQRIMYISCQKDTKQRDVVIGLTVTLPGGGSFTEWMHEKSLASVDIKALEPVVYTIANTLLTKSERTDYTNYYLQPSTNGYIFIKSEKINGLQDDRENEGVIGYKLYSGWERYVYYWNVANKMKKNHLGIKPYITADINDQPGSLTLTRTAQYDDDDFQVEEQDSRECTFKVYDQYGNQGLFKNHGSTGLWGEESTSETYWYDVHVVDA